MRIEPTALPGCFSIQPTVFNDVRGRFVKVFHADTFAEHGLIEHFAEDYYSVSHRGVLRGMHYQRPPNDHVKLVYCVEGEVLDAVLDLRRGSPTFGRHAIVGLSADRANMLYVPRGLAHGFYVVSDSATVVYKVETVHAPADDAGVAWNGCGIDWPTASPIVSTRDQGFPALADLDSPFTFEPAAVPRAGRA
jgi:dTDP-4-dehydrorhamnose 3,5-epimerase